MSQTTQPIIKRDDIAKHTVFIQTFAGNKQLGHGSGVITNLRSFGFNKPVSIFFGAHQKARIDPDYPIFATCDHVAQFATSIIVESVTGEKTQAVPIAMDGQLDIAFLCPLQIPNGSSFYNPAIMGDSSKVKQGDDIFIVGAPLSSQFKFRFSAGKIASISPERPVGPDGKHMTILRSFDLDASIKQGNSGGILTDANGHWIGINYAGLITESGNDMRLNFALQINDVILFFRRMIEAEAMIRPGLHIGIRPINHYDAQVCGFVDIQNNNAIPRTDGVFLEHVKEGTEAAKHFKVKDIIMQVNGDVINDISDFRYAVYKAAGKNKPVLIRLWRDVKEVSFNLNIPAVTRPFPHMAKWDTLGMYLTDSYIDDGITIEAVAAGSIAHEVGLGRDMIIVGMSDPDSPSDFIQVDTTIDFYTALQKYFVNMQFGFYLQVKIYNRLSLVAVVIPEHIQQKIIAHLNSQQVP